MKTNAIKIVPVILLLLLTVCSCNDYRKIAVGDVSLRSFRLKSTSSAEIGLVADVDNQSRHTLLCESAEGTITKEGKKFADFTLLEMSKAPAGERSKVNLRLAVKVVDPLALIASGLDLKTWREEEFAVDAKIVIRKEGGGKRTIKLKNVPAAKIIGYIK